MNKLKVKYNIMVKISLDIPKGKSISDCYLSEIQVIDKDDKIVKTINKGLKPLKTQS